MPEALLTVNQAASQTGVTPRTVRLWIEAGRLAAFRVPGKFGPEWRLRPADLAAATRARGERLCALLPGADALASTGAARELAHATEALSLVVGELQAQDGLVSLARRLGDLTQQLSELARAQQREHQHLLATLESLRGQLAAQAEELPPLGAAPAGSRMARSSWLARLRRPPGSPPEV